MQTAERHTQQHQEPNVESDSLVNQLRGLKDLLDEGTLTPEEFEEAKKIVMLPAGRDSRQQQEPNVESEFDSLGISKALCLPDNYSKFELPNTGA